MHPGISAAVSGSTAMIIPMQLRTMRFNRSVETRGGFHFLGVADIIKAVGEGLIPITTFLLDETAGLTTADFTSNLTTNVDTLLNRLWTLYRSARVSYDCFALTSLFRFSGATTDAATLADCVFGPGLPSHKDSFGGARPPLIEIDGAVTVSLRNLYIRGKTTITSTGIFGSTTAGGSVPLANNAHYGSAAVNAPWTWEQTYHTFIGPRPFTSANLNLILGGIFEVNTNPTLPSARNYYADLADKLLPNHIHLLDNSGALPADTNTGPYFDQFIHAPARLFIGRAFQAGAESQSQTVGTRRQGFIGRFGRNGYNATKTRGVLGGNTGFLLPETGFTFEIAEITPITGTARTIFQRAGMTSSEADSVGQPTFDASSTSPGDGFPTGLNPVITTASSGGLNVGLRSYLRGISTANAITVPVTNLVL
jgi:hypothetical protein